MSLTAFMFVQFELLAVIALIAVLKINSVKSAYNIKETILQDINKDIYNRLLHIERLMYVNNSQTSVERKTDICAGFEAFEESPVTKYSRPDKQDGDPKSTDVEESDVIKSIIAKSATPKHGFGSKQE